jgi:chromosome segregation ATPase
MTQAPERTTAPLMTIFQEISEISENRDLQLASVAALLDQFGKAQKDKLSKLKTSAESAQKGLNDIQEALGEAQEARLQAERDRDDTMLALAGTQSDYQASQDALKRVTAELDDTRGRLAKEEAARLALEADNVKLRDERNRLNGIVNTQQDDLRKLSTANDNIKRRIRNAAIAASVIVAVGLTTWLSGAHALILAAH